MFARHVNRSSRDPGASLQGVGFELAGLPIKMEGLLDRLHRHRPIGSAVRLLPLRVAEQTQNLRLARTSRRGLEAGLQLAARLLQVAEPGEGGGEVHPDAGEIAAAGFAFLLPISLDFARRVADQLEILILEGLPTEVSGESKIL